MKAKDKMPMKTKMWTRERCLNTGRIFQRVSKTRYRTFRHYRLRLIFKDMSLQLKFLQERGDVFVQRPNHSRRQNQPIKYRRGEGIKAGNICELAQFTVGFFDWLRNWREMSQPIKRKILASTWDERRKSIHLYLKHGIAAVMKCKCSRYHKNSQDHS